MGFTTLAFCEDIDGAGAMVPLAASLNEQHLSTNGDDIQVPEGYNQIIGACGILEGTADVACRLVSPSLREYGALMLPYHVSNVAGTYGNFNYLWPQNPIPLDPGEDLNAEHESNPGAASEQAVIVFLSDGPVTPVTGDIRRVRATAASVTTVSASWVFTTLSLTDDLKNGIYALVGATCTGANAIAFRIAPLGGGWRPGGLVLLDEDDIEHPLQRNGGLGEWMRFDSRQLPGVELLCGDTAGAGAYNMILDVIRVG